jgi:2-oxoglutarate dehydrogenase E2 component (dihydrolipoamide succinyltransferase)
MGQIKVILPAMGEGIFEATIIQWLAAEGAMVNEDDSLVEIATDKVDSEVPSPVTGVLSKILVPVGAIAKVGQEIAIISVDGNHKMEPVMEAPAILQKSDHTIETESEIKNEAVPFISGLNTNYSGIAHNTDNGIFLSPLVRSIAQQEGITMVELSSIKGTGIANRITKDDLMIYLEQRKGGDQKNRSVQETSIANSGQEIIEMNRMRKLIAENMIRSKQISAHVTSFHEVDLTEMVSWREKYKDEFQKRYGHKITYTPLFINAVVRAIKKFPLINISVEGTNLIVKNQVNIGMATALPDGNLIVPVIHNADSLSLSALANKVNDLANRARTKKLLPAEIQGGTFTLTNVGTFGNLSGTPIINQPEVAIMAVGAIKKRPAVIETPQGDFIGIRHIMILSLSYDHRVVDGSLGGMFLKQVADNMEAFDGRQWL